MTIGTRDQFKRAIERAQAVRGWERVTALGGGRYEVGTYTITVDTDGEYRCTCTAGGFGQPCWHQASVWLVAVQRAAFRPLAVAGVAA